MNLNPYASPVMVEEPVILAVDATKDVPSTPRKIFARWLLICYCCSLPSFLWGMMIGSYRVHIAAMLSGIFCFVIGYTFVECSEFFRRFRQQPHVESTLIFGFTLRIVISILFPIAMYCDMFLGMFAIALAQRLGFEIHETRTSATGLPQFFAFFVTTLIQGTLVNLVLFGFMGVVYSLQRLFARR
jgi:hypothetical protein